MLGKIQNPPEAGPIRLWGNRNGEEVRFTFPPGGVLEIVSVKETADGSKKYICQITIDGVKYTNVVVDKAFVEGDARWFDFIRANQAGGKKSRRRRRRNRRRTAK